MTWTYNGTEVDPEVGTARAWSGPGTLYVLGEFVTSGGATYIAVDRHTSGASFAADSAHWTLLPGGGGGSPTGAAGGVLSGTYPNPGFAADMATQAELNAEASTRGTADGVLTSALSDHLADSSDAHDASAVSVAAPLTEGNAQAELERLSLAVESSRLRVIELGGNLGASETIATGGDSVHARGAILNANCAITTTGKPAGEARWIKISGVQDATGGRTVTVDGIAVAIPAGPSDPWEIILDWDGTDGFVYFPGGSGVQGVQGLQGVQGIQGIQGNPGADGDPGDDGDPGADGVIAEVQNEGTPLADQPILNFTGTGVDVTVSGGKYVANIPGGGAPDADASTKGLVQLAGDLAGTAASPQIAPGAIINTDVNAAAAIAETKLDLASDAAAGTASRRTLGTGAAQAAAGNHTHALTQVDVFTANGTWTKPSWAVAVEVVCIAGGGGGGGGRKSASGTVACGGGGGGGAGRAVTMLQAASLGSTVAVVVGTGGSAGAGATSNSANGGVGGAGAASYFGASAAAAYVIAPLLGGGLGGSTTTGIGSTGGSGPFPGANGANASGTGGAGSASGTASNGGGGGGGSGGGVTTAPAASAGGAGGGHVGAGDTTGGTAGTSGGGAGGAGSSSALTNAAIPGGGGAGGGSSITGNAGNGGNGAFPGGGGGGGGGALDSTGNAGNGGAGGAGLVVVVSRG